MPRSLDDVFSEHKCFRKVTKAACNDLRSLLETKNKTIRSQKKKISRMEHQSLVNEMEYQSLMKEYQRMVNTILDSDKVTLVDFNETTSIQIPASKVCQFSPFLKTAFTGTMQEAQTRRYKTNFDELTLRVLAKAIVCDKTLWKTVDIFQDCEADDLVRTMEACDFLGALPLFEAALDKLQSDPRLVAAETAFTVMKLSNVSEWKKQWQTQEDAAAKSIARSSAMNGAGSLDPTLLKQLDCEQLAKVFHNVPRIEDISKSETATIQILSTDQFSAEAALLEAHSEGAYVQIPVRNAAIPINNDLHLPMEYTFEASLTASFTDDRHSFESKYVCVPEARMVSKTIKVKGRDESCAISLMKLRLEPHTTITSLQQATKLELSWVAVPLKLHLQCYLLLQSRDATLTDLAYILGSTEESDCLAGQILLDYATNCFPHLCKCPALLDWPAGPVRKLVERLGADKEDSEPLVLRFLLAWVARHGEEGSQLLDDLMDVDLGWSRTVANDGGLTPHEKSMIMGSRRFKEVITVALESHYCPRPSVGSSACGSACTGSLGSMEGRRSNLKRRHPDSVEELSELEELLEELGAPSSSSSEEDLPLRPSQFTGTPLSSSSDEDLPPRPSQFFDSSSDEDSDDDFDVPLRRS